MSKLTKVSFIAFIFLFNGCSFPDYFDSVSNWFNENQEVDSIAPPARKSKKFTKKSTSKRTVDNEAKKIIQRYFRPHETGIYVHLDSVRKKKKQPTRKKRESSEENQFAPPIAAPVEKVVRQDLP